MRRPSNQGFALPIILCAVGILAAALVVAGAFLDASLESEAISSQGFTARQLALSGIVFGSAVKTERMTFTLTRLIEGEGKFTVTRRSDSGLVNLNALLKKKDAARLIKLLQVWGANPILATQAVDSLLRRSWLQAGEIGGTNSANFIPFESFAQLQGAPEFAAAVEKKPDWRNRVTLWGSGGIDLNYAGEDALIALGGFSAEQAAQLVQARSGPDGIPETEDDAKLDSADQVAKQFGLDEDSGKNLATYFGGESKIVRLEASAKAGRVQRQVMVIMEHGGENGWKPIVWNEE